VFDVGSSMMFGMGSEGTTNLITRALSAVGRSMETVPDPTQIHYRLPKSPAHPQASRVCYQVRGVRIAWRFDAGDRVASGVKSCKLCSRRVMACVETAAHCRLQGLEVRVWKDYEKFIAELTERFPHEAAGIRKFYDECWKVCDQCMHSVHNCLSVCSVTAARVLRYAH
jgi:prolycopene isomerase